MRKRGRPINQELLDETLARITQVALAGERCPQNTATDDEGLHSVAVLKLARSGAIKIEVYGKNYRVIELVTGPHAGRRTKAAPDGYKLYRTIAQGVPEFPKRRLGARHATG